ncbi:Ig-like domain-containing protein [Gemmatimonas sp.]|uniref:Ig-like domain-containing protein n=1 Tax=Gemmatimonas sp. TaxID=1962908 RepID=UPI00286AC5D5|nr:Ig-like domain-containing protein [Gemmatimonas sp.]
MYTRFAHAAESSVLHQTAVDMLSFRARSDRPASARTSRCGPLLARASIALLLLSACSGDKSTGPGPVAAAIKTQAGNAQTGVVGAALTVPLAVVVTDKDGKTISGARVDWDVGPGSGTASPTRSTADARGVATTVWNLGTTAGTARLTAQVNGVTPVVFTATVIAGPAALLVASPEAAYLNVSDTVRVRGSLRDQFGNTIVGQSITYSTLDPALASVSSTGLVTAVAVGTARVIAEASGKADTVPVSISAAGSSVCGPLTARALALGEVYIPPAGSSSITACLTSPAAINGEYALTLVSTATSFGTSSPVDLIAIGSTGPTLAALTADANPFTAGGAPASVSTDASSTLTAFDAAPTMLSPVRAAELARREIEQRELTPLVSDARDWMASRTTSSRAAYAVTAAEVKVGDVLRLNVNANVACSSADLKSGRVAAVGTKSIIVSDTENPTGGYTDTEYAAIAATFDTLVFPMDTTAFGAPSNVSGYGKIILLYTRAVNALTPSGAGYTIGGFFFARDLYPKSAKNGLAACAASNEAEMFYLLAPDPNGTVNSNKRTKDEVTLLNLTTIAHEFQHLINSSRRLYVNTGARPNEETWLDEGLSHLAEELLYFRIANVTSRQNLSLTDVAGNATRSDQFRNYASQNFSRFYSYLIAPEVNSPYAPNDSLATRGASWNFLRYAAGRQGATGEASFLRSLVNSNTTGVANLQNVLSGSQFADYLRDWSVSLIADDFSVATTAALSSSYIMPSWNFRSIYPGLRFSGGTALGVYPIATRSLMSGSPQRVLLAGGTSSFVRFGIPAGRSAIVTLSSNGALPPSTLRYALTRLR